MDCPIAIRESLAEAIVHELELGSITVEEVDHLTIPDNVDPATAPVDRCGPVLELLTIAEDVTIDRSRDIEVKVVNVESPVPHDRRVEGTPLPLDEEGPKLRPDVVLDSRYLTRPELRVVHLVEAVDALYTLLADRLGSVR
jgi:hypothetical protein